MVSLAAARCSSLGAGEMGEGIGAALVGRGRGEVVGRQPHATRGRRARRPGRRPAGHARRAARRARSSRRAAHRRPTRPRCYVERGDIEAVMERRDGAPLLVVDVAVPRDVDPGAGEVPGVTLLDIDDLKRVHRAIAARASPRGQPGAATSSSTSSSRYRTDRTAREVAPLVTSLRRARRGDPRGRARAVPGQARRARPGDARRGRGAHAGIVNKLLHEPTVRLKDAAGTARGRAVRRRARRALRPPGRLRPTDRELDAPRSRRAAARWRGGRPNGSRSLLGGDVELVVRLDQRRPRRRHRRSTRSAAPGCS